MSRGRNVRACLPWPDLASATRVRNSNSTFTLCGVCVCLRMFVASTLLTEPSPQTLSWSYLSLPPRIWAAFLGAQCLSHVQELGHPWGPRSHWVGNQSQLLVAGSLFNFENHHGLSGLSYRQTKKQGQVQTFPFLSSCGSPSLLTNRLPPSTLLGTTWLFLSKSSKPLIYLFLYFK